MKWYGWYCLFGWFPYIAATAAGYDFLALAFVLFDVGCFGAWVRDICGVQHVANLIGYRFVGDKPAAGAGGEGLADTRADRTFDEVERVGGPGGCGFWDVPPRL